MINHQPKCKRCKTNTVPRPGMVCNGCRKHPAPAPSRATPIWARILAVRDAGTFSGEAHRLITTADILALRNKSLLSASGTEFEVAADLAERWNQWMAVTQ